MCLRGLILGRHPHAGELALRELLACLICTARRAIQHRAAERLGQGKLQPCRLKQIRCHQPGIVRRGAGEVGVQERADLDRPIPPLAPPPAIAAAGGNAARDATVLQVRWRKAAQEAVRHRLTTQVSYAASGSQLRLDASTTEVPPVGAAALCGGATE